MFYDRGHKYTYVNIMCVGSAVDYSMSVTLTYPYQ